MKKNTYLSGHGAWGALSMIVLFVVLAACGGGSSNAPTATNSPVTGGTAVVGIANASPSPTSVQPGKTPTSSHPSPTPSRPTPTPTHSVPTPTPTPVPTPRPTPTPKPTPTPTPVPTTVVVMIIVDSSGNFAFSPQTLNISVGTSVTWKNTTSAPHTVTGSSFGSGTIPSGGTFSFTFTKSGSFAYQCMIHPYMMGTVKVS